jgi:hypothetical protein
MKMKKWIGGVIVTFGLSVSGCVFLFDPIKQSDGETGEDTVGDDTGESETGPTIIDFGEPDPDETGIVIVDAIGFDPTGREDETGGLDLGGGCEPPPFIDPRRTLIETNPEALLGISMAEILTSAALHSDLVADPQFTHTRLLDSFNPKQLATLTGGSHCDDVLVDGLPSLNGYPIECPRAEAGQVGNLDAWFPIAAVNRFDLAAADGSDCGEQRLIVASNQQSRMFVIFEARIPNPDPSCGLLACRPIVDFWLSLSDIDDPNVRAEQLRMAFLDGHPQLSEAGFEPFMSGVNLTFGSGQIRSNSFDQDPWTLRQFRFVSEAERLGVVAVPVTGNVFGPLWNDLSEAPQGIACRQSILANLQGLLVDDVTTMGMLVDPICFAGESRNDEHVDYATHLLAGSGVFEAALADRLAQLGSDLHPVELANRATFAVSCMGCHELALGLPLGHALFAPISLGFVQVDEFAQEPCTGGGPCFAISPGLDQAFLPARLAVLENFWAQFNCDASCAGAAPNAIGLLLEGPATTGVPPVDAGTEQLLAWERALRAELAAQTLGGRPHGAH